MLARYLALPGAERRDAWSALWRLLVVRVSLISGVHRTRRLLGGKAMPEGPALSPTEHALWERRALALKRVGQHLPGVHCLARSLALRWWMRARGCPGQLVLGIRKFSGQIDSHSWIEVGGIPMDEEAAVVRSYREIWREVVPSPGTGDHARIDSARH